MEERQDPGMADADPRMSAGWPRILGGVALEESGPHRAASLQLYFKEQSPHSWVERKY